MGVEIVEARSGAEFDAVRELCWAYRDFLVSQGGRDAEAVLHFYGDDVYRDLMQDLPRLHARPGGSMKLAMKDGAAVGCGMSYGFAPGVTEIKRVYLRPEARGLGAGEMMMRALIDQARADGYERIYMDTGRKLEAACALYDRLGFQRRGPYQDIPEDLLDLLVFYEMAL